MAEGEAETKTEPSVVLVDRTTGETNGEEEDHVVINLQNQLEALQNRVKELELENAKMSSQLSSCRCRKSPVRQSHGNGLVSRGPGFSLYEDISLSQSWLEGCRDPVLGVAPKKDTLREWIADHYESHKPNHFPTRTTKSLRQRWDTISTAIKNSKDAFAKLNHPIQMTKAKIMFAQTDNGKKGFTFDHVWPILEHVEKWDCHPHKQIYETSHSQSFQQEMPTYPSSGTPSGGTNLDDEYLLVTRMPTVSSDQPKGGDQEKSKRKKPSDNAHIVTNLAEHSYEVSEMVKNSEVKGNGYFEKLDDDCDRKLKVMMLQAENECGRLEYEKYDKDIKITEKDVNLITNPVQRSFFTSLQAKIQEKWAN